MSLRGVVNTAAAPLRGPQFGLPLRVAILAAVFLAEKIFLNQFVDFDAAQNAQGLGAWLRVGQHWGFRFFVALTASAALFAYVRGGEGLRTVQADLRAAPIRIGWILVHFLLIAALAPLSFVLYRYTSSDLALGAVIMLWLVVGLAAVSAALWAMAPANLWWEAIRALGALWWYAAAAALLGTAAMQLTQSLWAPTAALTFDLVRRLLTPILPALTADPATMVLSTGRFSVQIAEVCSGLEGVGLILAFSVSWLLYFRHEYIFPRALLLIPASIAAIFALNVVRIASLILIGDAGFADVAVYGFHSQAGWIAFNAVACGLVLISRRSAWLNRTAARSSVSRATDNPTAAYLMPLLAILAAGTVSRAFSSDFEFFYPLRVVLGGWMLWHYRRKLAALDWHWSWRGPACGAIVFILWAGFSYIQVHAIGMPGKLAALPPALRGFWIAGRLAGGIVIVPIAEELAYRGYLMRRLIKADFESVSFQSVRWPALAASAILFGIAHGALWLPGIAAGVVFGLLIMRRGQIGEAVVAHATSNAMIALCVLGWQQWQLW
jgi:exosortase E/protease (VPEID-CTERM system)